MNKYEKVNNGEIHHRAIYEILRRLNSVTLFNFVGLRRSGNHAIIKWILHHYPGFSVHYNDINNSETPLDVYYIIYRWKLGLPAIACTYEDMQINDFLSRKNIFKKTFNHFNILIIRDPFNLFASRYAWKTEEGHKFRTSIDYRIKVIALWKDHAKSFLGWSNNSTNCITINYNRWCLDLDYQKKKLKSLKIPAKKINQLYQIPNFGYGSSFTGIKPIRNKKQFTQRFLSLKENPNFMDIFHDKEIFELSKPIFGDLNDIISN